MAVSEPDQHDTETIPAVIGACKSTYRSKERHEPSRPRKNAIEPEKHVSVDRVAAWVVSHSAGNWVVMKSKIGEVDIFA